ncbi:MAG: circularly permuted type 2 ATP-grasp protein [Alphaproteobacteria bacterium]
MSFPSDLFAPTDSGRFAGLIDRYRSIPGVHDEMLDENGQVRPAWVGFLEELTKRGPGELARRFGSADRYLRESGVFYRVYDDTAGDERPWPLSHVPLIVSSDDWRELSEGLIERAEFLDAVLGDIYGPGQLVANGALPAAAVTGSPEFFRPLVGVKPNTGHLSFYAADIGRGPDGKWWVLDDRTQAPSGAGYALENRLAMVRALPEVYDALNVERLAGFFQGFRAWLSSRSSGGDSNVCVLTPGPLNETYFEHAYLARYLGFLLVEGADLTVRDDEVLIRTVAGLKRANVLWRRVDADFTDPLELNTHSHLGVPGLVGAVRAGSVSLVNALGSGLVEARALLGFMHGMAHRLLGRDLKLAHVATWWCGQHLEREVVLENLDHLVIAPAYGSSVPGILDSGPILASDLSPTVRAMLADEIRARGADFVAQEVVKLSTTPVWSKGQLEPRPFILRVFLSKVEGRWQVMPGGFCRLGDRTDARAVTMQRGGLTADVCVVSDAPVAATSLLPRPEAVAIRRSTGSLPSRAADNLFWLGRYTERAEATLRLLRALGGQFTGAEDLDGDAPRALVGLLTSWGALPEEPLRMTPAFLAASALYRRDLPGSLFSVASAARNAASVIRDRFSPDAWRAVSDLAALFDEPGEAAAREAEAFDRVEQGIRILASFAGYAQENMNQLLGWRFLKIGRRLERGLNTCRFARQFGVSEAASASGLDLMLALADSQITYRSRYVMVASKAPAIDLVLSDEHNPRSVAFQVSRIAEHVNELPGRSAEGLLSRAEKLVARTVTDLRTMDPEAIDEAFIYRIETALMAISDEIAGRYFTHRDRLDIRNEVPS